VGRDAPTAIGRDAEERVAALLRASGWTILGRNVRCGRHELDIVGVDPGPPPSLAIVEVRWRASRSHGLPEETVGPRKVRALHEALGWLLERGALPDGTPVPRLAVRLDLVAVEPGRDGRVVVRHHRGAVG
jgi:putative endonuclease